MVGDSVKRKSDILQMDQNTLVENTSENISCQAHLVEKDDFVGKGRGAEPIFEISDFLISNANILLNIALFYKPFMVSIY